MTIMTLQQAVKTTIERYSIQNRADLAKRGGNKFLYQKVSDLAPQHCSQLADFRATIRGCAQTMIRGYKRFGKEMTIQDAVTYVLETADIKTRDDLARCGGNPFLYKKVLFWAPEHCARLSDFRAGIRGNAQTKIIGYKCYN